MVTEQLYIGGYCDIGEWFGIACTISMLADDAAREADRALRLASFTRALENMKILAEGGTVPPR